MTGILSLCLSLSLSVSLSPSLFLSPCGRQSDNICIIINVFIDGDLSLSLSLTRSLSVLYVNVCVNMGYSSNRFTLKNQFALSEAGYGCAFATTTTTP